MNVAFSRKHVLSVPDGKRLTEGDSCRFKSKRSFIACTLVGAVERGEESGEMNGVQGESF